MQARTAAQLKSASPSALGLPQPSAGSPSLWVQLLLTTWPWTLHALAGVQTLPKAWRGQLAGAPAHVWLPRKHLSFHPRCSSFRTMELNFQKIHVLKQKVRQLELRLRGQTGWRSACNYALRCNSQANV